MSNSVKIGAGLTGAFIVAVAGMNSFSIVPAQSYGVRVAMGQLVSDHLPPHFYWKAPLFDSINVFNNNTIILPMDNIGEGNNTADQNPLRVSMRVHYKVDPSVGLMVLNLDKMKGDNGKGVLKDFAGQSTNAVVGSRSASDTIADPAGFLTTFKQNMQWRISQNNIPVRIDAIELLTMNIGEGSSSTSTGFRKVIQMRILPDGTVEAMSGPAAIAATAMDKQVNTGDVKVENRARDQDPSVATGAVLPAPKVSP